MFGFDRQIYQKRANDAQYALRQQRISAIKDGLFAQVKIINTTTFPFPLIQNQIIQFHDIFEALVNSYFQSVDEYYKQHDYYINQLNIYSKLSTLINMKNSHIDVRNRLVQAREKLPSSQGWVIDTNGILHETVVESTEQKKNNQKIAQIDRDILITTSKIEEATEQKKQFEDIKKIFSEKNNAFKKEAIKQIDSMRQILMKQNHGDWTYYFNLIIDFISQLTSFIQFFRIETDSEKILDIVEKNINVAIEKSKIVHSWEGERSNLRFEPFPDSLIKPKP